ncbi:haloalkane dehalogenase [bacterium]|nr:haloalkane dehalogenase [bacterium]
MNFLRTPESRFEQLKDYAFKSHYIELDENGMRMHYIDEGPDDADPILMLHGEPSWSYLYRHMIPICVSAGHRVIAPDFIGFGKSDKPGKKSDYSYQAHMDWMTFFIQNLNLNRITLFGQDWGAMIGLRLAAENEKRFASIIIGNGMLLTGNQRIPLLLRLWIHFASLSPWLPIHRIIDYGCIKKLTHEEKQAYNAPFPSMKYKAGVRAFPTLLPLSENNPATPANREAWKILEKWHKPFLTVFSDRDPFTKNGDIYFKNSVPGARDQKHLIVRGGHFLQEDAGEQLGQIINQFVNEMKINLSEHAE